MTYAKSQTNAIEGVRPHDDHKSKPHIRFAGDYKTFCGRDCSKWVKCGEGAVKIASSPFSCQRCVKEYWR